MMEAKALGNEHKMKVCLSKAADRDRSNLRGFLSATGGKKHAAKWGTTAVCFMVPYSS